VKVVVIMILNIADITDRDYSPDCMLIYLDIYMLLMSSFKIIVISSAALYHSSIFMFMFKFKNICFL